MKCKSLFSGKKKNISICRVLNFLPCMLSIYFSLCDREVDNISLYSLRLRYKKKLKKKKKIKK